MYICMHLCLPDGKATIFINGTRKDINRNSSKFRLESSSGIGLSCKPLALACNGILPLVSALHVLHTHCLPNVVMFSTHLITRFGILQDQV